MSVDSAIEFAFSNGLITEFERAETAKILNSAEPDDLKIKKLQSVKFGQDHTRLDRLIADSLSDSPVEPGDNIVDEILAKEVAASQKFRTEKQSNVQELRYKI